MTRRYDDDYDPPLPSIFFLQIYTIHVNDLFRGENGEFHQKVTSLHPCLILIKFLKYELKGKKIIYSSFKTCDFLPQKFLFFFFWIFSHFCLSNKKNKK